MMKKASFMGVFGFGCCIGVALGLLAGGEFCLHEPYEGGKQAQSLGVVPAPKRSLRVSPGRPILSKQHQSKKTGKLQGLVVDRQGKPMAGVQATLCLPVSTFLDSPEKEAFSRKNQSQTSQKQLGQASAVSDEVGRFELPQLTEMSHWVVLSKDGYLFQEKSPSRAKLGLREFVGHSLSELNSSREELPRQGTTENKVSVTFQILDPRGQSFKQATVYWQGDNDQDYLDWIPAKTSALLPPGKYSVYAILENDHGSVQSSERSLVIEAGEDAKSVSLTIDKCPSKQGHTLVLHFSTRAHLKSESSEESSPESLFFGALLPNLNENMDRAILSQHYRHNREYIQDLVCSTGLEPGPYLLMIGRNEGTFVWTKEVVIEKKLTFVDVALPKRKRPALCARAYAPNGQLLNDLSFSFSVNRVAWKERYDLLSHRATDGRYKVQIPHFPLDLGPQKTPDTLHVYSEKYGSLSKAYQAGQRELTFRFQKTHTHTLKVSGFQNCGVVGSVRVESGDERFTFLQGSKDSQVFSIDEGQNQSTSICIFVNDQNIQKRRIFYENRELSEGETQTEVTIPKLYSLTLETDFPANTALELNASGALKESCPDTTWARVNRKGQVQFRNLPAGQYKVNCLHVEMVVTVPAPGPIKLESKAPNSLEIKLQGGGYLASRGFKNGDIIVGLGGRRYTNIDFLELIEGLTTSSERFLVERQGREIEIVADPSKLVSLQSHLGGELREARH